MRNLKKWMTVAISVAMVVAQTVPAFATSADVVEGGTGSGTANILAYSVDRVVVPTTLKVALNPSGYSLVKGYKAVGNGAAAVTARTNGTAVFSRTYDAANKKWTYLQVMADGDAVEGKTEVLNDDALGAKTDTYYQYDFVTDQIISLNYGIANKSTNDKVVQIDIHVTQDTNDKAGKLPIEFVGTAEEATYDTTKDKSAKQDEMKMYLAVVSAKNAAPTTDTFERVTKFKTGDDAVAGTAGAVTPLYTKSDAGVYSLITADTGNGSVTVGNGTSGTTVGAVADEVNFKKALGSGDNKTKLYKMSTTIGPEITSAQLSDVSMTLAEAANQIAFKAGKENKANASIGFKLAEANYGVETGDSIMAFDTTQATLGNMLQLNGLTGVAGFTITGAMNKKVDWTRADTVALKIQPTYKVSDTKGNEKYVSGSYAVANDGTVTNTTVPFNQVVLGAAATPASMSTSAKSATISGLADNVTLAKAQINNLEEGIVDLGSTLYTYEDNVFSIVDAKVSLLLDNTKYSKIILTYSDESVVEIPIVAGD